MTERERRTDLSVVIPAYNEALRLPPTLDRLHAYLSTQSYSWEIVVVNNGSTDATAEAVQRAGAHIPNVRLFTIDARGKGIATRAGALASHGDVVFLCDADLSMPPEMLATFLHKSDCTDVVIGSREAMGARRFGEPWHRHMMGRVFNRLAQLITGLEITDTQCGFKAFRREAALTLFARQMLGGFAFDVELLYLARKEGYSTREVAIDWHFNNDSRVRPGVDAIKMLADVLLIRWRDARGLYGRVPLVRPESVDAERAEAA